MTTKSRLVQSLFDSWKTGKPDITDPEIVESVGIELYGNLRDLRYLQFIQDVRKEFSALRSDFGLTLEEGLEKAEEETFKVVGRAASASLNAAVEGKVNPRNLRTDANQVIRHEIVGRQNGYVAIDVTVNIRTGKRTLNGQEISDHKYFTGMLKSLKTVPFDYSGVYLTRRGDPQIIYLRQPEISPRGVPLPYIHIVASTFGVQIPKEMVQAIYASQKSKT